MLEQLGNRRPSSSRSQTLYYTQPAPTTGLLCRCSISLSYRCIAARRYLRILLRKFDDHVPTLWPNEIGFAQRRLCNTSRLRVIASLTDCTTTVEATPDRGALSVSPAPASSFVTPFPLGEQTAVLSCPPPSQIALHRARDRGS